jgi:dipeptidyl aminopeptidase/acylaminoacyl peptidase
MKAFVTAVVLVLAFSIAPQAQGPRPMGAVDLLNVPRLGDPQVSPDGKEVVYTKADPDWKSGRRTTHIWRAPVSGGNPIQLTNGSDSENGPRWSPDGKTIAFTAKRGDNEFAQIYLLPIDGGEARALTSHASAVSNISWLPDGSGLLFSAAEAKTADEKAKEKARDDVYAYEENYKHTHLWKVTVADKTETRITGGEYSVTSYELSGDGKQIAYHRAITPLLGDGPSGEVWVANVDGSGAVQITRNGVPESGAALSPDNAQVLFTSGSNAKLETYYNGRLFVAPATGGAAHVVVGEKEPYDVDNAAWSSDGKSIYFLANLGVHEELFVVPAMGGTPKQLTNGKHNLAGMSQAGSRFAFTVSDSTTAGEVYVMDATASAPALTRVTHVFDYLARDFKLGRQEAITWKGADGVTVEGILTYPADYQAGQKYPLVVMTHGGPQAADKFGIGSAAYEIQVLAGKRLRRAAAELSRQHRLWRRLPPRHDRPLLSERASRRDGRRRRGDQARHR